MKEKDLYQKAVRICIYARKAGALGERKNNCADAECKKKLQEEIDRIEDKIDKILENFLISENDEK